MKKEPNKTVAKLRKLIGKTQEQFAVMLGVSKDTIVSVENGRNRLTPGLAYRIHVATGVNQLNLLENTGILMTGDQDTYGRGISEYTRECFEKWRKDVFDAGDDPAGRKKTAQYFFDHLKERIEVLLIAATRPGMKGRDRFPAVMQSLENWINTVYYEFELAKEVDQVLREETFEIATDTFNVGFLRASIKEGNPFKFKFKDSKKYKDSDSVKVNFEYYEKWDEPYVSPPERKKPAPRSRSEAEDEWDFSSLSFKSDSKVSS
jgi:transcriptional regulator with XRE-family HTH domain